MELKKIGIIVTDLPEKFGLPRQSSLAEHLRGFLCFEPEYRDARALEGIGGFDYLWLVWGFDVPPSDTFRAMVRPPRLGGNAYRGVFATRSPFRPNPIGLSCVKLEQVLLPGQEGYAEALGEVRSGLRMLAERGAEIVAEDWAGGPILRVSGIDMRSGTAIYDIKPYLPYVEAHPKARGGFAQEAAGRALEVDFPRELLEQVPEETRKGLTELLRQDPRPAYQEDPERVYGLSYGAQNISFRVTGGVLTVTEVKPAADA
ncbi:MAG: tRNA (N6-threonylcarbamoyladenosine(37)-N6)-methyltransferase TrmO [Lachnospiraceae bacterium]|nr:tRNA (N6-threonylcarbamoyladenosine(37)-N6)-methyltransferase TrmO [Lachnospiraceae bacterium]